MPRAKLELAPSNIIDAVDYDKEKHGPAEVPPSWTKWISSNAPRDTTKLTRPDWTFVARVRAGRANGSIRKATDRVTAVCASPKRRSFNHLQTVCSKRKEALLYADPRCAFESNGTGDKPLISVQPIAAKGVTHRWL